MKSYKELITLLTFDERFEYLSMDQNIGDTTFGFSRFVNQSFYRSKEWKDLRSHIIVRDNACDLGIEGREINSIILIHHINPLTIRDFELVTSKMVDPDNLITVSRLTHNAIHYGTKDSLEKPMVIRKPNDTCPWKEQYYEEKSHSKFKSRSLQIFRL